MTIPPFSSPPTPAATSSKQGKLKLTNDLGGSADSPTVIGLTIASEAEGDMLYRNATEWVRLAKGTASQELRMNAAATAPEWYTPSASGGQTTYDAIVAPSGGDYTTLGAAIAAASNGWSIFVKEGTYSEGAVTSTLTNLTIVGESKETVVLALGTSAWSFTGVGVQFINIGFTATTGYLHNTGARSGLFDVKFIASGFSSATASLRQEGNHSFVLNCHFENTVTLSTTTVNNLRFSGAGQRLIGNYFKVHVRGTSSSYVAIFLNNSNGANFSDNYIEAGSMAAGTVLYSNNERINISGNTFYGFIDPVFGILNLSGSYNTVTGNIMPGVKGRTIALTSTKNTVVGNTIFEITGNAAYGIYVVAGSNENTISGNNILGANVGTAWGVYVENTCDDNQISANNIRYCSTGVEVVGTGAERNAIIGNKLGTCTTPIVDTGTQTTIEANDGMSTTLNKKYLRLKNTSGATINPGNVVVLKAVAAGDEITTTTTAGDTKVVGMAIESIANNAYGYVQVAGKTTLMTVDGTTDIAIGDFIGTFTTAGIGQKASSGQMAIAMALEAYAVDNSSGVIDALLLSPRLI